MLMDSIEKYLALRRSLGYKLDEHQRDLANFARFAEQRGETYVVAKTAAAWAEQTTSREQRRRRLSIVTEFARFIRIEDQRHEIPPEGVFVSSVQRRTPYIFEGDEIRGLLEESLHLHPKPSLRPHMYHTLFGLLAVTGLRISEALALTVHDIGRDGLIIRDTKFGKNRLVPMHESTDKALITYMRRRRIIADGAEHLFLSAKKTKISYSAAYDTFRTVCKRAGIPRRLGVPQVRFIDLRHTFAVRALEAGPDKRDAVTKHMVALMTYLGHASLASTYWYLESTPHLMRDIADTSEAFATGEKP